MYLLYDLVFFPRGILKFSLSALPDSFLLPPPLPPSCGGYIYVRVPFFPYPYKTGDWGGREVFVLVNPQAAVEKKEPHEFAMQMR